ncbi:hypothetical protein BTA51_26440 [Hahella sp. CCB-MM4]|uniref:hypothetical protein n=1 Tax=Hahella sp. (strain CCB-MM4) TaxID=1926491 RepID=UPI000B9A3981|nr:hypothetical protein [Hahella sp. CCB-MM4]OZG70381.1 hypothetical protein BTA51_26440 [Hahella sp. CCB-MM4]
MTIYRVELNSEHYMSLHIPGKVVVRLMRGSTPGQSLAGSWKDVSGSLQQNDDTAKESLVPDISCWYTHLVFSKTAFDHMKGQLESYGEFLPVSTENGTWYVFNVMAAEGVDKINSEAEIADGVQVGVTRIAFENNSTDKLIIKTDFDKYSRIFCTDEFRELVNVLNLKGLIFDRELV